MMSSAAKNFDILATSLSILHNYFDSPTKIIFKSASSLIFRYFKKKPFFPNKIKII